MRSEKRIPLKILLTEEEYRSLEALARAMGYELPSHLVESIVRGLARGEWRPGECPQAPPQAGVDPERLARRLERAIQDLLNPFTAKIDEIARRLGEIQEAIEALQERPGEAPPPPGPPERPPARPVRGESWRESGPRRGGARRRSAMERLSEEGVLFASEAPWIKDPERCFQHLEKQGAIVVRAGRELAAVDPGLWRRLVEVLGETAIRSEDEAARLVESALGEAAARLFRLLVREGLAYYDEEKARWVVQA